MPKHGKKYTAQVQTVERDTYYAPRDAMALVKQNAQAKFDETVEVHLRTALDPRQADQHSWSSAKARPSASPARPGPISWALTT